MWLPAHGWWKQTITKVTFTERPGISPGLGTASLCPGAKSSAILGPSCCLFSQRNLLYTITSKGLLLLSTFECVQKVNILCHRNTSSLHPSFPFFFPKGRISKWHVLCLPLSIPILFRITRIYNLNFLEWQKIIHTQRNSFIFMTAK